MKIKQCFPFEDCPECGLCILKEKRTRNLIEIHCRNEDNCKRKKEKKTNEQA